MKIFLICLGVYLLGVALSWFWVHLAYSKNGIYYCHDIDRGDFFGVITPVANLIIGAFFFTKMWPIKPAKDQPIRYSKFFLIKK